MFTWLIIFGSLYAALLAYSSYLAKKENNLDPKAFALGGGNLNIWLGVLTYSATLFSTFTLMGMPNFFRTHGVGAWIFLGVTDVAMAFVVVFVGLKIHKRFQQTGHYSIGTYLRDTFKNSFASQVFLLGIFVFLIPYTAIQIKGISSFLEVASPFNLSSTYWAVVMLAVILTYSTVGGFKAIVYSDAIQGVILLIVSWLICYFCVQNAGGVEALFRAVEAKNEALLSTPGPKGLFSPQFLLASFMAIVVMPITQPQLTTRLIAMKDRKKLRMMAPSVAFFVIAVILPAAFIGMYGAVNYGELGAQAFWNSVLIKDQPDFLGALALVGLMAAAMSTTDSQLFALGNEANIFLEKDKNVHVKTKLLIFGFAAASLLFSVFSKDELVPLARLSFAGTAILAPMILLAIMNGTKKKLGNTVPVLTLLALALFMGSSFVPGFPKMVGNLRMDLFLYIVLTVASIGSYFSAKEKKDGVIVYDTQSV